jgi:hypothetical protein
MTTTSDISNINGGDSAQELADEDIAMLSDFHDNVLSAEQALVVKEKIATDQRWRLASEEFAATKQALSGLQKARAPVSFANDVAATIAQRSGGAFFGRRAFGDRVPFGALLVIGLILLSIVGFLLWNSQTGSLQPKRPAIPDRAPDGVLLPGR